MATSCTFTKTAWRRLRRRQRSTTDTTLVSIIRVDSRLASPLHAQRIGEAKNPGPVSSLIAQTQQTILDAFSQGSSRRRPDRSAERSDTQLDSSHSGMTIDAPRPRLADTFDVQLLHQAGTFALTVQPRPGNRWQWCLQSQPLRLRQFANTPAAGLIQFIHKHGAALQAHSRLAVEHALRDSGHSVSHSEDQTPMQVSIATLRAETEVDLDTQLDSLSVPPPTPPQSSPVVDTHGDGTGRHPAHTQAPAHLNRPLAASGPHMQHMGLIHVPDTIAVTRTDGKKVSMRRRVMPLYGTCHYAVRAKPTQTGPFKATAALALQAWVTNHGHTLLQESQDELAALLER
eukprot:6475192-Amphidinium_carterae.1